MAAAATEASAEAGREMGGKFLYYVTQKTKSSGKRERGKHERKLREMGAKVHLLHCATAFRGSRILKRNSRGRSC